MADGMIAEAIRLMSFMSQDDIKDAVQKSFSSPGPLISAKLIGGAIADWKSPQVRLQRMAMGDMKMEKPPTIRLYQHYHTYEDGSQAGFEVDYTLKSKVNLPFRSKVDVETLWKDVGYLTKAGQRADAFLEAIDRLDTPTDKIDLLMKAAEKCGIPKTKTELLAKNGNIGSAIKTAATRVTIKTAVQDGAWQSAAQTAVFDIQRLFDGEFKRYLSNIGVSGLYGGTINGLSSWVNHPFFGNGIVLGVVVNSAFGAISLASTGDWASFGKGLGVGILGGAASWGGAAVGGAMGVWLGPIGVSVGAIVGSLCGGFAGRRVAAQIPILGEDKDHEVKTAYRAIIRELASAGLEPDPSLTSKQVVEAIMNKGFESGRQPFNVRMTSVMASDVKNLREVLFDLQKVSPDAFGEFLDVLRAARNQV